MLTLAPIGLRDANAYVAEKHRHHKPVRGMKFALAAEKDGVLCGVVIVGRPVARLATDGRTLEVNRCCTDGTRNACSFLYAAAWRATQALGYDRLLTYTLPEEGGASLRACGWREDGTSGGGSWSRPSRTRIDAAPLGKKVRWVLESPRYSA